VSIRNYSNTAAQSTLSTAIGATDTSIALANYAGDPTPPFTAALARGTATEEIVLVTAVIGSTVTVVRGYDGTSAQSQAAGVTFQEVVVALDFREANNHVNATGAVHGTSSALVGVSDVQTLTNKTFTAPQVTSLTGTGTTTLAATNVTTLAVSGVASVAGLLTASGGVSTSTLATSGAATLASAQVTAAPAAAADVVRKDYADALGTAAPTVSTIVRRDSNGRTQFADLSAAADAATKNYVDGQVSTVSAEFGSAVTVPYTGSWADMSSFTGLRATKIGNVVVLTGVVQNTAAYSTQTAIGTLPTGYHPTLNHTFPVLLAGGLGRVDIGGDGLIRMITGSTVPSGSYHAINCVFNVTT
jgi:hypothetical protein